MVHGGVCDETQVGVGRPFPEDDIFVVNVGLHFLLRLNVEDLQCPPGWKETADLAGRIGTHTAENLTLQRKDLLLWMHDCRVRRDGSSHEVVCICQVDNNDLVLLVNLLSYTYEVVALERQVLQVRDNTKSGNRNMETRKGMDD